ncbi:hypothetical protein CIPAW_16G082200 [Carya illinoinensis]|uniref:Uncharacterized protein n=1 Tax=Carya illinoinensis TaxID=32201 RepID=A0A8T1N2H1_CARIL|nr:hypothetical protein CIPAW_16G082200 [Carya illinoinensis]
MRQHLSWAWTLAVEHLLSQDMFELVGAPFVENCLAGFNNSIFAYGGGIFQFLLFLF